MGMLDFFKSKGEKNETIKKAKEMLVEKQERRQMESKVMERVFTTLDRGELDPSWSRATPSRDEAGAMEPRYQLPWNLPPQRWQDMISHQEGLSDADISRLNADYDILNGYGNDSINNHLLEAYELDKLRNQRWSSATDMEEVNIERPPEGGY